VSEVTAGLPSGRFPLTHLWFLYYLLVLYALVLLCRGLIVRLDRATRVRGAADAIVRSAIRSGTAPVLLAIPVSLTLYLRHDWFIWFGIPTPDVSLVPELTSVAAFGTAMVFGWLVHRQRHLIDSWRDQWPVHLLAAAGATTACLWIAGLEPSLVPEPAGARKLVFAACYALAIWTWNFAIIGLALRFLSENNPGVRYVADASYWIYMVHLPVVAAIQVLVGNLQWHWGLKLPMILAGSLFVLFLSYDLMVRPTVVGKLLNGRKYPRQLRRLASDGGGERDDRDVREPGHRRGKFDRTLAVARCTRDRGRHLRQEQCRQNHRGAAVVNVLQERETVRMAVLVRIEGVDEHACVDGVAGRRQAAGARGRAIATAHTPTRAALQGLALRGHYRLPDESASTPPLPGRNAASSLRPDLRKSSHPVAADRSSAARSASMGMITPTG
jgi:hypothetical protein